MMTLRTTSITVPGLEPETRADTRTDMADSTVVGSTTVDNTDAACGGSRRGRNTRNNRRPALNYRDLQAKILPELHLLAKEVGLSDYRQHK